jgi:hypothetical protein
MGGRADVDAGVLECLAGLYPDASVVALLAGWTGRCCRRRMR